MRDILEVVQKVVRYELDKIRVGELGVVTSVFAHASDDDANNYECNVKLKNSAAEGSELELRKVPIATGVVGSVAMPNVGDLVLISFVGGDINQPIVTGRLYNNEDRPPLHKPNEIVHRVPLAAEDAHTIKLDLRNIDDNDPPREVVIEMPAKVKVQIIDHQFLAQVGQSRITVSQPGDDDGAVMIESGKSKVTIRQDGDIQVESDGQMTLTAKGDMSLRAPNIKIRTDQELTIEAGTNSTFKTGAEANFESSAPLKIKSGATARIEAAATMDIKGALVNIN
jgi:hypothetical protein